MVSAPRGPGAEYELRLAESRRTHAALDSRDRWLSWARLATFVLAAILAGRSLFDASWRRPWIVLPLIAFAAAVAWHDRVVRARRRAERRVAYYSRGLERLDGRWAGAGSTGAEFLDPEHPYASDLDLFGRGSLYERISAARTPGGAVTLARWLTESAEPGEVVARQRAIAELVPRLDLREDLAVAGEQVEGCVDTEDLAAWAERLPSAPSAGLPILVAALALSNVASLVAWWTLPWGGVAMAASFTLGGGVALTLRGRTRRALAGVERRVDELHLFAAILARIEREEFETARLVELKAVLDRQGEPPSRHISRLAHVVQTAESRRNMLFAPVAALLLLGTQLGLAVERWRGRSGGSLRQWFDAVGQIEALASLAGYAFERPEDPFPEVVASGPCFVGEGLAHPLLAPARAVRNDVRLDGELRLLVVSGSNMSGKSTLLRTVGVNAVLASAGAPVCARRLCVSPLAVGAAMRIADSLQEGTSHFYAEIRRLRRLVEIGRGPRPLLFLLDELFHGTNSHDRRVGAEAVLRGLVRDGGVGLVTTHDLALAAVADGLAPRAANVHFEDRIEGDRVVFDYRLRPGVVQHSNAIALMRAVGLDVG